jgi:hypothetical protein
VFANKRMIQDGDHRPDRLRLDRLIPEADRASHFTWATIGLKSQMLFDLHDQVVRSPEPQTYAQAGQRSIVEHQRQLLPQPACHSLVGRTTQRRQAFNKLPDQADTCQKEP